MDLARIQQLLKLVTESNVAEVEVEEDGVRVVIRKHAPQVAVQGLTMPGLPPYAMPGAMPQAVPQSPPQLPPVFPIPTGYPPPYPAPPAPSFPPYTPPPAEVAPPAPVETGVTVRAPIVGTFYTAPSPDKPAFVKVGDTVSVGQVICIIEAMKLMNEIKAETAGTVKQVLAKNAQPVEYDQPLFLIAP